jgi:DNA invertase Pin-like site-specific DNA recombinase
VGAADLYSVAGFAALLRDAVIAIIATVAKQERVRISQRVKAGLETARAKGKSLGRPRVIADRAKIGHLRAQGLSWAKIAMHLGIGVGKDRNAPRHWGRYSVPAGTRIRQKPPRRRARKSLRASSRLSALSIRQNQMFKE